MRIALVAEQQFVETQNPPNRRPRHSQIPTDSLERTALAEMGLLNLRYLVHAMHRPLVVLRQGRRREHNNKVGIQKF